MKTLLYSNLFYIISDIQRWDTGSLSAIASARPDRLMHNSQFPTLSSTYDSARLLDLQVSNLRISHCRPRLRSTLAPALRLQTQTRQSKGFDMKTFLSAVSEKERLKTGSMESCPAYFKNHLSTMTAHAKQHCQELSRCSHAFELKDCTVAEHYLFQFFNNSTK